MPRNAEETRNRILAAAYRQFFRKGFSRVSVDDIAAEAAVTKRTLYYHFKSKDDLLAEMMAAQHGLALERAARVLPAGPGDPRLLLETLFDDFRRWVRSPHFTGGGFSRIVMELADLPGHPAREMSHRHKVELEHWYADRLADAGVSDPGVRARELMLLMEGLNNLMLIHGDEAYLETARELARSRIADASPK